MFVDLPRPSGPRPVLWDGTVTQRVGRLLDGELKVAWFYGQPDTSTFRYRVANVVEAVNSDPDGTLGAAWFSDDDISSVLPIVPQLDAIVLTRHPYGGNVRRLAVTAQRHGVPVLFDTDDLVFDVSYADLVMDSLGRDTTVSLDWDVWFAYMGRLNATLRLCEGAFTTNQTLRSALGRHLPLDRVQVVPNVLNRAQQDYSQLLWQAKIDDGYRRSGPVTIGYFSGTPSHVRDFTVAAPALARLLAADPDVAIRIAGFLDDVGPLEEFRDRIEFVPFMHYIDLQRSIAEVEVNIAPLRHNAFNVCKSDLKYFEAAVVGTWTVASHTPSLDAAITDGVSGRLARDHEWDQALAEAVDLARRPERYAALMDAAAEHAHRTWAWDSVAQPVREAITAQLAKGSPTVPLASS
ncbi:MAG: glycosyltransferase [Nocardioides sp.]|nr:glycosyltransferase [Nocardioides sp.]